MTKRRPSKDPSVEYEPHLQDAAFEADPSETRAAPGASDAPPVEQSVWDEPARSPELAGDPPPDAITWAGWLQDRVARSSAGASWTVTIAAATVAGPLAVVGTFFGAASGGVAAWFGIVTVVVLGPVFEEVMKAALPLSIVEKRPYLFRSRFQIGLCMVASGLVFGAIENILYLRVYVPRSVEGLAQWRWSVCVAMHAGCSLIAGLGLMRIWSRSMAERTPPRTALGAPYILTAVVIHATYNAMAVLLDAVDYRF